MTTTDRANRRFRDLGVQLADRAVLKLLLAIVARQHDASMGTPVFKALTQTIQSIGNDEVKEAFLDSLKEYEELWDKFARSS